MEAVREDEVKLRGIGFVKEVGFKPGVKERKSYRWKDTIRYDTVYLRACVQKLTRWPVSLAHRTETKKIGKTLNKNRVAQKKLSGQGESGSGWRYAPWSSVYHVKYVPVEVGH